MQPAALADKVKLCARNNWKIKDVSEMSSLRILDARGSCGIDDLGIKGLKLVGIPLRGCQPAALRISFSTRLRPSRKDKVKLNANYNGKISNISGMNNLKILDACGSCGIDDLGIEGLKLIKLNACFNSKITDVSAMNSLRELDAFGNCGISDLGIRGLKLIKLNSSHNRKIEDISGMTSLRELDARGSSGINYLSIKGLKLKKITTYGNSKIKPPIDAYYY